MAIKTASKGGTFCISFCWLLPWCPPGQYGASSCLMAASSGFWWSSGYATLGDALRIALAHHHGHHNGPRRRCFFSPPSPILIAVIITKDHVMVNFELDYCSLICYWLVHTILAAVDNKGHHFGHNCPWRIARIQFNIEVNINKLISMLMYWIY
jgi:hypothetical protein